MTDSKDKNKPTQDKPATPPATDPSPYNPIGRSLTIEKTETPGARPGIRIDNKNDE